MTSAQEEHTRQFERAYLEHAAEVLRYGRWRVGASDAEDLVAETYAVVWRRIAEMPENSKAWIFGIARKISANMLRKDRRSEVAGLLSLETGSPDIADGVVMLDELTSALSRLRRRHREALLLVVWHDLTSSEAAQVVGCSESAMSMRVSRARGRLRELCNESIEREKKVQV